MLNRDNKSTLGFVPSSSTFSFEDDPYKARYYKDMWNNKLYKFFYYDSEGKGRTKEFNIDNTNRNRVVIIWG